MRVHLLHVNDIHSQIENHMRIGAQLRALRRAARNHGEPALTFDIGDALDRVRPETEVTSGRLNAALLGALGVDGWVFGNNEGLTIPRGVWPQLQALAETSVFGTNLRQPDGRSFPYFADTRVYDADGVKVGVFGVTPNYEGPYAVLGVRPTDPFLAAAAAVRQLQGDGCDVIVALSHLGLHADRALAEAAPEIDVILGGHTHHFMEAPEVIGNTVVFQAGKHGFAFGQTVIDYDPGAHRITGVQCELVRVNPHGPFDQAMLSAFRGFQPDLASALHAPITCLESRLQVLFDRECAFANLLVDALFDAYPCDLGIMMAGALTASLLAGEVTFEDVHGSCSTPTRPLLVSLRGEDIWRIVERSVSPEVYGRRGFGFGFRGSVVGFLAVSNARVELQQTDGGLRLSALTVGGEPLEWGRWYRVVTCEYLWLAPVFPEFHGGENVEFQPPLVRELLLEAMRRRSSIDKARTMRYHCSGAAADAVRGAQPSSI